MPHRASGIRMKKIVLDSPKTFRLQDAPSPIPGPGEALVRIRKVGVCGSDIHLYRTGAIGNVRALGPMVIGHECMGEVVDVGAESDKHHVGDRVAVEPAIPCGACRWCASDRSNLCTDIRFLGLPPVDGAMQQYIVHPMNLLRSVPDTISDGAAVMLEPLAVALHAVNLAKIRPDETAVILGTGVIGSCVLSLLRLHRDIRIVCVDRIGERLERATDMGADQAVLFGPDGEHNGPDAARDFTDRVHAATGERGADRVFECAGDADSLWHMVEVAAPGAHVAVIGSQPEDRVSFSSGSARRKGLTLRFVRRSLNTLDPCIRMVREGLLSPDRLVTHIFPATEVTEAFTTVERHTDGVLKALIDMDNTSSMEKR